MPKIRALYQHQLNSRYSPSREYFVGKEGVQYKNHYVVLRNQRHGKDKFICGHCDGFTDAVYVVADIHINETDNGNQVVTTATTEDQRMVVAFHCESCNQYIAAPSVQPINEREKVVNTSLVWADHYLEGDDIVRFKWMSKKVSAWGDKIQVTYTNYMVLVNVRTGQSYVFEPWSNGKRQKGYQGPKLANITYELYTPAMPWYEQIPMEILESFYQTVYEKVSLRLGYKPKGIHEYHEERNREHEERKLMRRRGNRIPRVKLSTTSNKLTLNQIILFNRFPNLNPLYMEELVRTHRNQRIYVKLEDGRMILEKKYRAMKKESESTRRMSLDEVLDESKFGVVEQADTSERIAKSYTDKKISSIKPNDPNQVGSLMKAFKIPNTKTYRKHIAKKPLTVTSLRSILQDFKEADNIRKIMETDLYDSVGVDHRNEWLGWGGNRRQFGYFMDEMIEKFGETIWTNKIVAGEVSYSMLKDAGDMYYQIKNKNPNLEIDMRGNVYEMHENFTEILESIKHTNYALNYTEEQLKLVREIDGYKFYLGVDTNELRKVGRVMRICVGGYADRARAKQVHIALMTKDDQYVMCIELSSDSKLVRQAKLHCNNYPDGEEKEVVTKWIQETGLLVDCRDLPELQIEHYTKVYKQKYGRDQEIEVGPAPEPFDPPVRVERMQRADNALVAEVEDQADNIAEGVDPYAPAEQTVEELDLGDLPAFVEIAPQVAATQEVQLVGQPF